MAETDHDILIEVRRDVKHLAQGFTNHLHRHWMIEAGLVLALIAAIAKGFF